MKKEAMRINWPTYQLSRSMKIRQLIGVIPNEEKSYLIAQNEEMLVTAYPIDKETGEQLPFGEDLGSYRDIALMDVRIEIAERLGLL